MLADNLGKLYNICFRGVITGRCTPKWAWQSRTDSAQMLLSLARVLLSLTPLTRAGRRHNSDPCSLCFNFQATTSTNWILESQNINELKSEINSLKGLLLNR